MEATMQLAVSNPQKETHEFLRKVSKSGHICYNGQLYFVTKALAGEYLKVQVLSDQLIIEATIPIHKQYSLRK